MCSYMDPKIQQTAVFLHGPLLWFMAHTKFLDVFKLQILLSNFEFLSTIVRAQLYLYGFLSLLDHECCSQKRLGKKTFEKQPSSQQGLSWEFETSKSSNFKGETQHYVLSRIAQIRGC